MGARHRFSFSFFEGEKERSIIQILENDHY